MRKRALLSPVSRVDGSLVFRAENCKRNIAGNQPIINLLVQFAEMKGCTSAQVSLAWMLHKWPSVVPIPGSKNKGRSIENFDVALMELTEDEFASLFRCAVYGHRGLGGF